MNSTEKQFIDAIVDLLGEDCVKYRNGVLFRGDGKNFNGYKKNVNTIKANVIRGGGGSLLRISVNVIRDILPDGIASQINKKKEFIDLNPMEITITEGEALLVSSWLVLLIHGKDVERPRDLLVWQSSDYAWSRDALKADGRKVK